MPLRDSATPESGRIGDCLGEVESSGEVFVNGSQQRDHGGAHMIARDVGVQIAPQPLDPVLVRAVRRQEVQLQPGAVCAEPGLGQTALVDDVVVEDQMDDPNAATGIDQRTQQIQELPARLAIALDVDQPLVDRIVGARQVAFLVLPGVS